jgi:hypothetical protein
MEDIEHISDQLLREIIQLEIEIEKITALNGNSEDFVVSKYRKIIMAKKNKMMKLNNNYKGVLPS